jgi:hypothetical protein
MIISIFYLVLFDVTSVLRPFDGTRLFSNSFGIRKEGLLRPFDGY